MNPVEKPAKGWTAWGRFGMVVLIALVVCSGMMAVAFHYRAHLLWQYQSQRMGARDVKVIPNRPMPESSVPDGWVRHTVGPMVFSLPPEFTAHVDETTKRFGAVYRDKSRSVLVAAPDDAAVSADLLRTASKLCPHSRHYTLPRLRLACYQASSADFRWSMMAKEIRWYTFLMTMRGLMECGLEDRTETLFRADVDGILGYSAVNAVYYWQTRDENYDGFIHFRGGAGAPDWIRAVCRSVQVSESDAGRDHQSK